MSNFSYSELREQIIQAAHMLFQAGVMSHSGHGNMSIRLPEEGQMLLTATGNIAHLAPEQLAVVTFDGDAVEGSIDPVVREIVGMHGGAVQARSGGVGKGAEFTMRIPHRRANAAVQRGNTP